MLLTTKLTSLVSGFALLIFAAQARAQTAGGARQEDKGARQEARGARQEERGAKNERRGARLEREGERLKAEGHPVAGQMLENRGGRRPQGS
jgi:hypothetical protein